MKQFFKKFSSFNKKINLKSSLVKFFPILVLKAGQQKYLMKDEDSKGRSEIKVNETEENKKIKGDELEMKDIIRGEYENKIRAFSSIEKKFYLFAKKGENGKYEMDYVNLFQSLIPFPYTKVIGHSEVNYN